MDNSKTYPSSYSDIDIKDKANELSQKIETFDSKTGLIDNLIKDSVLFNVAYIELQNRENKRISKVIVRLTWVSVILALASVGVAWLSYKSSEENTKAQTQQQQTFTNISNLLELINKSQLDELEIAKETIKTKNESIKKNNSTKMTLKSSPATKP